MLSMIAPSGGGKGTVVKYLLQKYPDMFALSVSATTRNPRPGEIEGVHYYFVSPEQFKKDIKSRRFVEYEEVYEDKFYGTYKDEIQRINDLGKVVIFDIDYKGATSIQRLYPDETLVIGLLPPGLPSLDILEKRLRDRELKDVHLLSSEDLQKKESDLQKRLIRVPEEILHITMHEHVIVNDILEQTLLQVEDVLRMYKLDI